MQDSLALRQHWLLLMAQDVAIKPDFGERAFNALITPSVIAKEALAQLEDNLVMANTVSRSAPPQQAS